MAFSAWTKLWQRERERGRGRERESLVAFQHKQKCFNQIDLKTEAF
jgi:hypothetical protein